MAYNGGYYLPSVSDEGILSWSPTVEGMAPIPEVNVRGPQGSDASVTAEAVQAVVPMAWGNNVLSFGENATAGAYGLALGNSAFGFTSGVAIGTKSNTGSTTASIAVGVYAETQSPFAVSMGYGVLSKKTVSITIGQKYNETIDGETVTNTCTTEGTGSITIGAGANTLNNGDVESSNSVTIGCKAENKGADSVVIGAQASNSGTGSIIIGAGAKGANGCIIIGKEAEDTYKSNTNITIGSNAKSYSIAATTIGSRAQGSQSSVTIGTNAYTFNFSIAIGASAQAKGKYTTALGHAATVSDYGATVIRSTAEDGTYTQLYFSGANTPLANEYYNGEALMGYTVTDTAGTVLACGTRRLSELFTDNTLTQPASLDENGEWVQPKVFHPSDLDLPHEEPSEPEEYQPLPVYPIVEPELEEI